MLAKLIPVVNILSSALNLRHEFLLLRLQVLKMVGTMLHPCSQHVPEVLISC